MFKQGNMSSAQAGFVFDSTFGKCGINDEEVYYNPINGIDKRKNMMKSYIQSIQKSPSINTSTGGSVSSQALMPSFFDSEVVDKTMRKTPLLRLLPRKAVRGLSYVYNIVSSKGVPTAGTAGEGFKLDDASLSEDVPTRSSASVQMKFAYVVGRVTGPSLVAGQGFINLLEEDIRVSSASMNEILENEILNGNTSSNAAGFNGLRASITTNSTSNSGAAITLDQIRSDFTTVFEANGNVDLVVTDGSTHNTIKGLLMDFQRNVEPVRDSLKFGLPGDFEFDGAIFIKDRFMPTTSGSREILYLDLNYVFLATLLDVSFEKLAKTNDSDKYMLKWYGSLIVTGESLMAKRTSLA